jgi:SET domain-containing protein
MLKGNVKGKLKAEDEKFMRRVCGVMDTNSFETAVVHNKNTTSLRALFPLGAFTNHQCVPNTRHIVDFKGQLYVYSTMPIAEGHEITMTYTDVFWDTTFRRQFLRATKQFSCQCTRCSDVTVGIPTSKCSYYK